MRSERRTRNPFLLLLFPAILCVYLAVFAKTAQAARPNIIVILADDLGYGDPGCYNAESQIPTPNMDRVAEEGVIFTDAHAPNAVCTPSRYSLLTGRYCYRTRLQKGVTWPGDPSLIEEDRPTLGTILQRQGYKTACVGKWHLGLNWQKEGGDILWDHPIVLGPRQLGFDYFYGIEASLDMDPYFYIENDRAVRAPTETISKGDGYRGGKIAPDFRHDEVLDSISERALSFIHRQSIESPDTPFFLYFALTSPHLPWLPTGDAVGASNSGEYGDFVYMTDQKIGAIVDTLDALGIGDNTLIVVTSDNGARDDGGKNGHLTNNGLKGQKGDIWEGGHRVPFIARWPERIAAGSVSDEMICLTDLMATFAELVGEALPENAGEDSYNLLPALLGEPYTSPVREATVIQSWDGHFALRMNEWFLSTFRGSGGYMSSPRVIKPGDGEAEGELYNLASDPYQTNNLYLERSDIVDSMTTILERYRSQPRSVAWSGNTAVNVLADGRRARLPGVRAHMDGSVVLRADGAPSAVRIYDIRGRTVGGSGCRGRSTSAGEAGIPSHGVYLLYGAPAGGRLVMSAAAAVR